MKILFDNTHGEDLKLEEQRSEGLAILSASLRTEGFEVLATNQLSHESLKDATILSILFPKKPITDSTLILNYVNSGGGLLLGGEWGDLYGTLDVLDVLAQPYGIRFLRDRVTDRKDIHTETIEFMGEKFQEKRAQFAKIRKFVAHPITKGINCVLYAAGASLDAPADTVLAFSRDTSFGDLDGDSKLGPMEEVGSRGIVSCTEHGKGRVVCIGDTSIFTNDYIDREDNKKFCTNMMMWLARKI